MKHTILLTGAFSGIGKAAAQLFHSKGWNVIATMRPPENDTDLTKLDRMLVTRLDVTDSASITAAVAKGIGTFDALVNNAATARTARSKRST
jgi:NAD(P)-dependent dehydrogenase (short-subunit alcohol dehydrogenase family)